MRYLLECMEYAMAASSLWLSSARCEKTIDQGESNEASMQQLSTSQLSNSLTDSIGEVTSPTTGRMRRTMSSRSAQAVCRQPSTTRRSVDVQELGMIHEEKRLIQQIKHCNLSMGMQQKRQVHSSLPF